MHQKFLAHMKCLALIFSFSLVSCGERNMAGSQPDVFRGRDARVDSPEVDSTVAIVTGSSGAYEMFCSGTLIAPKVVASAAHCLEDSEDVRMRIFFGHDVGEGNSRNTVAVVRTMTHPEADIALLFLEKEAPASHKPAAILPRGLSMEAGDSVVAAGFGDNEDEASGTLAAVDAKISEVDDSEITVPHRNGSGVCYGDSGGPLYLKKDGSLYLVGAVSGGDGNCGNEVVAYANIHANQDWVRRNAGLNETASPSEPRGPSMDMEFNHISLGNGKVAFHVKAAEADALEVWVDRLNRPLLTDRLSGPSAAFEYVFNTPGAREMTVKAFRGGELVGEQTFSFQVE